MDYSTLERVKVQLGAEATKDDARIGLVITAASRAIDRKCTKISDPDAVNYFLLEAKTDEMLEAQADREGTIAVYPHKPYITAVTAFSYREKPMDAWITVDTTRIDILGNKVVAYPTSTTQAYKRLHVKISYTGGLATSVDELPEDLIEAATVLAIRYYKEDEGGLNDAIGIAELGQLIYTKAWPVRVLDSLQSFVRVVGWRH